MNQIKKISPRNKLLLVIPLFSALVMVVAFFIISTRSQSEPPLSYNLGIVSLPEISGWIDTPAQGYDSRVGNLSKNSVSVEYDSGIYSANETDNSTLIYTVDKNNLTTSVYEFDSSDDEQFLRIISIKEAEDPNYFGDKFSGIIRNNEDVSRDELIGLANSLVLSE
jgi:hypothetical protein